MSYRMDAVVGVAKHVAELANKRIASLEAENATPRAQLDAMSVAVSVMECCAVGLIQKNSDQQAAADKVTRIIAARKGKA